MIPENDIWIAASVKQHSIALVTGDKHFENIKDIDLLLLNPELIY